MDERKNASELDCERPAPLGKTRSRLGNIKGVCRLREFHVCIFDTLTERGGEGGRGRPLI